MVLSLTWVTMAATEMTDAELYGLSFFFSSVMVVVADAASSRVKQEGLSQILPGLRRPYFCLSPRHREFQRTKARISKKDVLAVVYDSMSFERLDTGGGYVCVSETFLKIFLVRLDMPCQQNVTSHTNV